jgi:hypothetical protein
MQLSRSEREEICPVCRAPINEQILQYTSSAAATSRPPTTLPILLFYDCGKSAQSNIVLLEAAQAGDDTRVKSLLTNPIDRQALNKALLITARSEPLVLGAKASSRGMNICGRRSLRPLATAKPPSRSCFWTKVRTSTLETDTLTAAEIDALERRTWLISVDRPGAGVSLITVTTDRTVIRRVDMIQKIRVYESGVRVLIYESKYVFAADVSH